jgi:hypothetical protein
MRLFNSTMICIFNAIVLATILLIAYYLKIYFGNHIQNQTIFFNTCENVKKWFDFDYDKPMWIN